MAIHPTAIIHRNAELDGSVEVGPFCVIDENVRLAAGCRLYNGVYVTGWTRISENCELHPGVIVGHAPQDTKYSGERTYCRIGARTILREYVTVHRGTEPESETVVGEDCFLLSGSHVAHNCRLGSHVTLVNNVLLAGHVEIGDNSMFGGAAMAHQFIRVGELVMVAGNARTVKDIVPFAMVDIEGRIAGLNRIGLRRAKFSREELSDIREGYRTLFGLGLPLREAMERLATTVKTPPGERLLKFVQAESSRGLAGPSRSDRKGVAAPVDPE